MLKWRIELIRKGKIYEIIKNISFNAILHLNSFIVENLSLTDKRCVG